VTQIDIAAVGGEITAQFPIFSILLHTVWSSLFVISMHRDPMKLPRLEEPYQFYCCGQNDALAKSEQLQTNEFVEVLSCELSIESAKYILLAEQNLFFFFVFLMFSYSLEASSE
jgi:hypothetical protein